MTTRPDQPGRADSQSGNPKPAGGKPQEKVEDRPVVGTVHPEDYPEKNRRDSRP